MLDNNKAGLACTDAKQCGSGQCLKQLTTMNLLGQASSADAPGGYCSFACRLDADCGKGGICVGASGDTKGQCLAQCTATSQCRDGYRCMDSNGAVVMEPASPSEPTAMTRSTCRVAPATDKLTGQTVGSMCGGDSDCSGGSCMMRDALTMTMNYPGGYCTGRCLTDSDCGDVGACTLALPGTTGNCVRKCDTDSDCGRDGYRCRMGFSGTKSCTPGAKPLADGIAGKACSGDGDCGDVAMSCLMQTQGFGGMSGTTYPGGYCTQACVDNSDCGAGASCGVGLGGLACYKTCSSASDCRTGYACRSPFGMFGGMQQAQLLCLPPLPMNDRDAGM